MKELDELLKENLLPDCVPEKSLNASIVKKVKETQNMKHRTLKSGVAAAAAIGILVVGSASAYAAYRYLTPSQVADQMTEDGALAKAFESKDAITINETQKSAGYEITLMGIVTGKDLSVVVNDENRSVISTKKTYTVTAITKEDGTPMPGQMDDSYQTFCVSALIHGKSFMDVNNGTLGAGAQAFVQDGVQYQLLECDDLEIFANMGVYLGVVESFGQESQAFTLDEKTGDYEVNKAFDGMQALFMLPLDKSKADDKAAEKYFTQIEEQKDDENAAAQNKTDEMAGKEQIEKRLDGAKLIESETKTVTPDEDGMISISTPDEKLSYSVSDWIYDFGEESIIGESGDGTAEGTRIETLTKNEDGTFTYQAYRPAKAQLK